MELVNYTPFMPLMFESEALDRSHFAVVVLKGTFEIPVDGPLRLAAEQMPLVMADEYYGDPTQSSIKTESDLAPYKPRADIHFEEPVAYAPGGKPAKSWDVRVRVGPVQKSLRVTGPRRWVGGVLGWNLTAPEPCTEVPIRYERAFGGWWRRGDTVKVFEENPVGVGFVDWMCQRTVHPVPAPQVESPDQPVTPFRSRYKPQGLGPLGRGWQPRLRLAGTFDQEWLDTKWPGLPDNFDFAHYNSAHPDLIAPGYLRGDEQVFLEGLHPAGPLSFRLPGFDVFLLLRYRDGELIPVPLNLDTLVINPGKKLCFLVWRLPLPLNRPLRLVEGRMIVPSGGDHA